MAVVNNSLKLEDAMTPVLKQIIKALDSTLTAMASVDKGATKGFKDASSTIRRTSEEVENMQQSFRDVNINGVDALRRIQEETQRTQNATNKAADTTKRAADIVNKANQQGSQSQEQFTQKVIDSNSELDGLIGTAKKLLGTYLSFQGVKALIGLSDQMAGLSASLDIINTGLRKTDNLTEKIRQSALRTGSNFMDVAGNVKNLAMMAGNAFSSNDEILYFTEQLNKQFAIAGVQGSQAASVMYNLTQALSSGVLRGNDFNILASNMGSFIDGIAETMGVTRDQMKKMAEEGKITASVVKKAMYEMADETNTKFSKIPLTFENIFNNLKTNLLTAVAPLLSQITSIINSQSFLNVISNIEIGIIRVINITTAAFGILAKIGKFIYDNWSIITPIVYGAAAALAVFFAAQTIGLIKSAAMWVANLWSAAAYQIALFQMAVAQYGLNAAISMCPLSWLLYAIIAVVAIVATAIAIYNKWANTGNTVIGTLVGGVYWLWTAIANVFKWIGNLLVTLWKSVEVIGHNIGEAFKAAFSGAQNAFWTFIQSCLQGISTLAPAIDAIAKVFGKEGFSVSSFVEGKIKDSYSPQYKSMPGFSDKFSYGDLGEAFAKGAKKGNAWSDAIGNSIDNALGSAGDYGLKTKQNTPDSTFDPSQIKDIAGNTAATKDNTKKLTEGINISDEDIELLKETARLQFVNKFTTMTPQVNATFGDVHETADVNGIMQVIGESVQNALESNLT